MNGGSKEGNFDLSVYNHDIGQFETLLDLGHSTLVQSIIEQQEAIAAAGIKNCQPFLQRIYELLYHIWHCLRCCLEI